MNSFLILVLAKNEFTPRPQTISVFVTADAVFGAAPQLADLTR